MYRLAHRLKEEVYGDRVVFFAPLYISDECANNCVYCGSAQQPRHSQKTLSMDEIEQEVRIMIGEGQEAHRAGLRGIPATGIDFSVRFRPQGVRRQERARRDPPRQHQLCAADRRRIEAAQGWASAPFRSFRKPTTTKPTAARVHPQGTIKGHYRWRLYSMDRAQQAGVDDVGLGVLFGLYDWRFEVMGLLYHTIHLEQIIRRRQPTPSPSRASPATGTL